MPAPAKRCARRSRSSAERSATQNSPSSAASIQPTGPGVPAAIELLELGDQPQPAAAAGSGADGGSRVQQPGELERRARLGELGADRRRQVLDVRDLDHDGLGRDLDPDRVRLEPARDPLGDDPVLVPVLVAAQQLLAEVVVDGRVGAAPGRAGERHGRGDCRRCGAPAAPGQAPTKAASGVPTQKQKQDPKSSRRAPKSAAGGVR